MKSWKCLIEVDEQLVDEELEMLDDLLSSDKVEDGKKGCFTCSPTVTHDEETASDLPRNYSMHSGLA